MKSNDAAKPSEPIKPDDIDTVIHERARLSIVSALAVSGQLSFGELKAMLGLTDGNLSVHSRTLEGAGYIIVEKSFQGRRPHTTMQLTGAGRKAFARYLDMLRNIVDRGATQKSSEKTVKQPDDREKKI
jgi:DNA-binding MarR family transcriptional regulator